MVVSGLVSSAGEGGAMTSYGATSHESTLDMTDVMDISCDPPGPSSGRALSSTASPSVSRVSSRPSSHVGEEIQAVTTRLHQVAVTQPDSSRASPLIQRTPSLEDNRALTSSAEELASTLGSGFRMAEPADSVWVPIDRPQIKSSSQSPEFVQVDRPEAISITAVRESSVSPRIARFSSSKISLSKGADSGSEQELSVRQLLSSPRGSVTSEKGKSSLTLGSGVMTAAMDSSSSSRNSSSLSCDARTSRKSSGTSSREFTSSTEASVHKDKTAEDDKEHRIGSTSNAWVRCATKSISPEVSMTEKAVVPSKDFCQPVGRSLPPSVPDVEHHTKKSPSITASEDDLWLATENKKDRKKKKRNKPIGQEDESQLYSSKSQNILIDISESADHKYSKMKSLKDEQALPSDEQESEGAPLDIDIDADYFHTAEEYHEPPIERLDDFDEFQRESFLEPQVEDFQEAQESVIQTLEDFELQADEEDREMSSQEPEGAMLRSIHDDNDLARALEEAYSSDDNVPVRTKLQTRTRSRSRPSRTSEMFPFKEDTSDDEEEIKLRRRIVVSASVTASASRSSATDETSTDDRGETSGDDRGESSTDDRKTGTSESDVGASPNPRASSASKNKKKKKKRR